MQTSYELEMFLISLGDRGMSTDGLGAVEAYIRSCWDKGVEVVLDTSVEDCFGTYNPSTNTLTLGAPALESDVQLIETLEHEFIHVLQDELDGIANPAMTPLGIPINENGFLQVSANYSHLDSAQQALELEAHSAEVMIDNPETNLHRSCSTIEEQLAVSYTAQGMDPMDATLQASLDAPLLDLMLS